MKLAVKTFIEKINLLSEKDYMFNIIAYNIAPTIKGVKAATTVTLCNYQRNLYDNWKKYKNDFLNKVNIKAFELNQTDNSVVVLFYDENLLNEKVNNQLSQNFLLQFGYKFEMNLEEKLNLLKNRWLESICPHEMGIFLGFPLEDVKTFIESPNRECLLCGYWKVYYNKESAMEVFRCFDNAKLSIIKEICKGKDLFEVLGKIA